jgi:carbon storage regulator CsrA
MLVLSRKPGQTIEIGEVKLTVLRLSGRQIRLGIDAPPQVPILRTEAKNKKFKERSEREWTRPPRILLVDDSPEDRDLYRRLLCGGDNSFEIQETESGEMGLEICKAATPDCVLLDYLLPDVSGLEFLEELAGSDGRPGIPVVMLTGHGDESLAVQSLKRGALDYLPKRDITADRLRGAVQDALNTSWSPTWQAPRNWPGGQRH